MNKTQALTIVGGLTNTTKMPCKSYSLPTSTCITGARMAQVAGSICANCYANKGNYIKYRATIEPAQHRRLAALSHPDWVRAMVTLIEPMPYFRWHDSGDLQGVDHLERIARVAALTPNTRHWLPTREYGMVAAYVAQGGEIPRNMVIRLSAMFVDREIQIPAILRGVAGIATSNVHDKAPAIGFQCKAPKQGGHCLKCRACWQRSGAVSYHNH